MEPIVNIHTHTLREGELTPRCEGVHPWLADKWDGEPPVPECDCEAMGEIGLDYACGVNLEAQERLFRAQLQVAEERGLTVILHCVKAFEPTMQFLARYRLRAVIFHGFIGSPEQALQALKRGYYLSFGERSLASSRTRRAMLVTPTDHLFVESDESSTPIEELYQRVSDLIGCSREELMQRTRINFNHIFRR